MQTLKCLAVPVVLTLATAGCNILNPEAGMESPRNPGTVLVRVIDEGKTPVVQVKVTVHTVTNAGSPFQRSAYTTMTGLSFSAVPAGLRRVEIELPAGFMAVHDGRVREVEVVKDRTTTVEFVLAR